MKHPAVKPLAFMAPALVAAAALLGVPAALAQSAGTYTVKIGVNNIDPKVSSGDLSAPSLPGTRIDVKNATSAILTGMYMFTDNISAELFVGLPYKHDVQGAGTIASAGKIATLKQVSPTLFAQYRFLPPASVWRPYVGVGVTYAKFYDEEGTGELTALTAPGGAPTHLSVDSAWGVSPQLGLSYKLQDRWTLDASVIKTYIKTTTHLSTGQSIDAELNPVAVNISVGYRF